jgi:hypothetical protein
MLNPNFYENVNFEHQTLAAEHQICICIYFKIVCELCSNNYKFETVRVLHVPTNYYEARRLVVVFCGFAGSGKHWSIKDAVHASDALRAQRFI